MLLWVVLVLVMFVVFIIGGDDGYLYCGAYCLLLLFASCVLSWWVLQMGVWLVLLVLLLCFCLFVCRVLYWAFNIVWFEFVNYIGYC